MVKKASVSAILCTAAAVVLASFAVSSYAGQKGLVDKFGKIIKEVTNITQDAVSRLIASSDEPETSEIAVSEATTSAADEVRTVKKIAKVLPSSSENEKNVAITSKTTSGKYTPVKQQECYQALKSKAARSIYALIGDNVNWISEQKLDSGYYPIRTITYSGDASETEIQLGMLAYLDDNPQVFWVAGVYGFSKQNGKTNIQLFSVLPPDECISMEKKLDSAVSTVISSIPSGLGEFAREEYLFHYLASHCTYDSTATQSSENWQPFSACGPLISGKAVCEGYSRAMQLLAGRVGINCTLVYGWHNGVGHMWNEIQINGSWYHLDLTWCDNSMLIYNYFNVTDSVIKKSHQISQLYSELSEDEFKSESVSFNFVSYNCNSVRDNYFQRCGIPVSSATNSKDQNIINQLVKLIKAGKTTAVFLIQDNFDTTVQKMGSGELSQWLLQAAVAAGKKPNSVEVKYVPDQDNSGVTVTFSFH
jgi:stress-induced morphogen